ncbi:MAG: exonuclease domain-containing protein [Rhodospirillaceae bacterium]|nr:exonuclease domain-containing protein [Rhodospirillaceae bacterium]
MLTFNAIDVETANVDRATICQIGIVHVRDGEIVNEWQTLVDPEDWFDPRNVSIHGIDEADVRGAPTLPEVRAELRDRLRGSLVASHTAFDRVAFERAMKRYELEQLQVSWIDSAVIARRTWPERYGRSGYGLKNVASDLGIEFRHHDALEDARAAAQIVLRAWGEKETKVEDWLRGVLRRRSYTGQASVAGGGNVDGPLFGEVVLFTGKLAVSRGEVAGMARDAGCTVVRGPSRKVTTLVVGTQDSTRLKGYRKSTKHRKVEGLIDQGARIRILSESDFFELIDVD